MIRGMKTRLLSVLLVNADPAVVQAAATRLQALAVRNPQIVLTGLQDPRLATRIQVANVLRAQLGETFDADAWSDEAARRTAVVTWSHRLPPH